MAAQRAEAAEKPGSPVLLALLGLLALLAVIGLVALGNWQMARRAWKLDLIARVDSRVHAPPVPAPAAAEWPAFDAASQEYRHVRITGQFLPGPDTLVQANIERGGGFWVLTPLRTGDGSVVLINRGFTGGERGFETGPARPAPEGPVTVTGLLRLSEPGGAFLRINAPAEGRWFTADLPAIAGSRGLNPAEVAPYFIDADTASRLPSPPVAGLTVISFPNNHLVYAITWYGLALMVAGAGIYVARYEWQLRRGSIGA